MLQEELEESKAFALQGAQRSQKKVVKESSFCLPESCSQSRFRRDAGVERSRALYTTAPAHGISSRLLQGEGGTQQLCDCNSALGQTAGPGTRHSIATVARS